MSILVMSKIFYTDFPELPSRSIKIKDSDKKRIVNVSPHVSKIVMLAISDSADDFGQNSWNSIDRLATKTNLNRRTVIRTIKVLADNGYLTTNNLSEYGTNNLEINLNKLGEIPKKRAKVGRPVNSEEIKTSGSESETSGSESETSGSEPSDSSLSILKHITQETLQDNLSSPAKKNGDNMNKEEYLESIAKSTAIGLTSQKSGYAHFNENERPWVQRVCELWNLRPPARKSKDLAFWISGARELEDACGEFGVDLLDEVYADWRSEFQGGFAPFKVGNPNSLVKTARGKAGMKRQGVSGTIKYGKPEHQTMLDV